MVKMKIKQIKETRTWLFGKINETDKPLARYIQGKRGGASSMSGPPKGTESCSCSVF